ncbi:hypothetical protein Tco_1521741 [Tanacetum coccineum]
MSTPVFVDPEISTQADGAQSPRVRVQFPKDPYEAIRLAYLVETETPESPHTVALPTSLPDSTPPTRHAVGSEDSDTPGARSTPSDSTASLLPDHPLTNASPTLVPILRRTARMAVRVPLVLSLGLSASIAERTRVLLQRMRILLQGRGSCCGGRGLQYIRDESLSLGGDEAIPEGQQRAAPVMETTMGEPLRLGYRALRRREIALGEVRMPSVFEVGQSSRSVPKPERPERVSALRQPTLTTWIDTEDGKAYIDVPAYPPPAPLI